MTLNVEKGESTYHNLKIFLQPQIVTFVMLLYLLPLLMDRLILILET